MNRLTTTVLGTAMALMLGHAAQASDLQVDLPQDTTARSTVGQSGPISQPLLLELPLNLTPGSLDQGHIVHVAGVASGRIELQANNMGGTIQSRYDYHLTLDAVSAGQTTLRLIDTSGGIAISGGHAADPAPPIAIDALIPQGFDVRQLTLSLSVAPRFMPLGIGASMLLDAAPFMLLPDSQGAATITSLSIQAVPEAQTWMLMSIGLACVAGLRRIRSTRPRAR